MLIDERLRNAARGGNIVLIVGTGSSAAISGAQTSTWKGLLESGIDRLQDRVKPETIENLRSNLEYGFSHGDLQAVLQTADRLKAAFDGVGAAGFGKWLTEDIGRLEVQNPAWGEALRALPFPLLTTNYDTLLSSPDRNATTWLEPERMQEIMSGTSRDIGHLHGMWKVPSSIVLSSSDYDRLLASDAAIMLERAIASLKTIVFIGYGAGLADPNFGQLIRGNAHLFPSSQIPHFRLCLDEDLAQLQSEHVGDNIVPVSYGEAYSDLPSYLAQLGGLPTAVELSDAGIVRDVAGAVCVEFAEMLVADAILADAREVGTVSVNDVVLPPVLLPVPHAEFVKSQGNADKSSRISRIDPWDEARSGGTIVLVGEEGSGLTTAAKWLGLEAATGVGGAPFYMSFRSIGKGLNPLARATRALARNYGWSLSSSDALPPHVLILDDFSPYVDRISERAIADIAASDAITNVVACAYGSEDDVIAMLRKCGIGFKLRYIGKLRAHDIRKYAEAATPTNHSDIARRVIDILTLESLPRTPYTVGLLISVLLRGATLTANASQTTILDDYVGAMLGRGDPHEDARIGLDQIAREALLSSFAKHFVLANTGGVPESDAVAALEQTLQRLSWSESPTDVLESFVERRVLRKRDGEVMFARSSFLHLFAAKRAVVDPEFRAHLMNSPLYYSGILCDYAAISRRDSSLVEDLSGLLIADKWDTADGGVFAELDAIAESKPVAVGEDEGASESEGSSTDAGELEVFDLMSDGDPTPFPTTQHENLPSGIRLMRVLELVSRVLRDSDQIEDGNFKGAVLLNLLERWGHLMSTLEHDAEFRQFVSDLETQIGRSEAGSAQPADDGGADSAGLGELGRVLPAAIALGGVNETLASKRLTRTLGGLIRDIRGKNEHEVIVATAFLVFAIRDGDWVEWLRILLEGHEKLWVVRDFLVPVLIASYVATPRETEASNLLELCLDVIAASHSYDGVGERNHHRNLLADHFRRLRLNRWRRVSGVEELDSMI